jgi:hypothetical protein
MMNLDVKENVRGTATLQYFRNNALWYRTEAGLMFPVPVEDIGDATFNPTEKGLFLMRWVRKHIEVLKAELRELETMTKGDLGE